MKMLNKDNTDNDKQWKCKWWGPFKMQTNELAKPGGNGTKMKNER